MRISDWSSDVCSSDLGVIRNLERRMLSTDSAWMREELGKFQASAPCEACDGARLKPEALAVKVAGETIADAVRRPVDQAYQWAPALADKLPDQQRQTAERTFKES